MSSSGQFWFFPGLQAGLIPPPPRSEGAGFESVRRLHRDYKVLRERCEAWRKRDLELSNQLLEASVPSPPPSPPPPCFRSVSAPSAFAFLPPRVTPLFAPGTAGILKTTYGPRNKTNGGCHVSFGETQVHIVERWIKRSKKGSRSKPKSRSPRVTAHPIKFYGDRSLPYKPASVDGQLVSGEYPVPFVRELIGISRKELPTDIPGPVTWAKAIGFGIAACAAALFTRWLEA
ncbi:hypothetical protein N7466_006293 [Penicillium verhagenii]|uniref:uncharacterized protein n=1 Tax=Penicillium verhagenii TaxID=1562060 RepID=UPI0025455EC6|nr:uncharacterized protein N7466_006293 [Penicillium verhagenii]KAJ5930800.1 hypothetical protein N7466_006293 [Penicillium verhagenii]